MYLSVNKRLQADSKPVETCIAFCSLNSNIDKICIPQISCQISLEASLNVKQNPRMLNTIRKYLPMQPVFPLDWLQNTSRCSRKKTVNFFSHPTVGRVKPSHEQIFGISS